MSIDGIYKESIENFRGKRNKVRTNRKEKRAMDKRDDWVEKIDKKIIHYLWTIFVSMVTALIVVYLKMR